MFNNRTGCLLGWLDFLAAVYFGLGYITFCSAVFGGFCAAGNMSQKAVFLNVLFLLTAFTPTVLTAYMYDKMREARKMGTFLSPALPFNYLFLLNMGMLCGLAYWYYLAGTEAGAEVFQFVAKIFFVAWLIPIFFLLCIWVQYRQINAIA